MELLSVKKGRKQDGVENIRLTNTLANLVRVLKAFRVVSN